MKHFVKFFVVTFFLVFCTHVIAEQKIVVLDLTFVLNNSKAGKGAQEYLKKALSDNQKKFADTEKNLKNEDPASTRLVIYESLEDPKIEIPSTKYKK